MIQMIMTCSALYLHPQIFYKIYPHRALTIVLKAKGKGELAVFRDSFKAYSVIIQDVVFCLAEIFKP